MSPLLWTSLLALVFAVAGCQPDGATSSPNVPPPVAVTTLHPQIHDVIDWDEYSGHIEAIESVEIRARVSGYLQAVKFQDGNRVNQGDLLFVIDQRNYLAELKQAESELERVKSRMALAQNDLRRADRLRQTKAISDEEYDQRSKSVTEWTAAVHGAEAAAQLARLNLEYTEVRAPISGRIGRRLITPGNLISGDQTLLTTLVSTDPVYVYLDADEQAALKYRRLIARGERGQEGKVRIIAELGLIDEVGYPHLGYLDYAAPGLDAATGTLRVRGIFSNPEDLLSPGLFARIRIHGGNPHPALLIPNRAIATDQDKSYVWLARPDHSVEIRPVELGEQFGSFRDIRKGLTLEDTVIVTGLAKLRPGVTIKPEPTTMPFDG